jgi:hypothetical protein
VLARVLLLLLFAPKIVSVIIRILLASGVALAVYVKGRDDCAQKHLKREIEVRKEHSEIVANAMGAASDRALRDQTLFDADVREVEDIINDGPESEIRECISGSSVERLRELQ